MEKSLLESKLEEYLQSIGMPLGERIYIENIDLKAELRDTAAILKLNISPDEIIVWAAFEEKSKKEYEKLFLERRSKIFNELGFVYSILHPLPEGKLAKDIADELIRNSRVGEDNLNEGLEICYLSKSFINSQNLSDIINKMKNGFYEASCRLMDIEINENHQIITYLERLTEKKDFFSITKKDYEKLLPILEKIERRLNNKFLNEDNSNELMSYLGELKKLVE